jgi:hypothetical protein
MGYLMEYLQFKQIMVPVDGQLVVSLPVLTGCLFTAFAVKKIKMFLPSIGIGVIIGLLTHYFFA